MSIATSQQIAKYYETFRTIDVTFTKEVVRATGLLTQNVYIKCIGEQWPCVVYSSSFDGAKVLVAAKQTIIERVKKANGLVSLRFSFRVSEKADPVSFFVSARAAGFAPYVQSNGTLQFMNVQFTQRPPDDYVEIMGRMLEANVNSKRRSEERVVLTPDVVRKIGLARKEATVVIQGVPRRCILRDVSFSGAKIIIVGLAKYLVGKACTLRIDMEEPRETVELPGIVKRFEDVEGRKDLAAIGIRFDDTKVPMSYKMHMNDYLGQIRRPQDDADAQPAVQKAPSAQAEATPAPRPGNGTGQA
ncbi:MAG: PilZ domain-containing protein [Spirochaetales bacterium]|nr:PilZ domain-containing protein [Spirochaetales bacterium]MBP7263391.1 PilZ domain-containing protein [Spirochaetia bacterium]